MSKLQNGISKICHKILYIAMLGLCLGMMLTVVECFLRKVFRYSIVGGYELTQVVFSVIVFGAIAYTQTQQGHICVTIFLRKFPQKVRFAIYTIVTALSTLVCLATAVAAFKQVFESFKAGYTSAQLGIPSWPFYLYESIMLFLFSILLLCDTVNSVIAIRSTAMAEEIQSHWD